MKTEIYKNELIGIFGLGISGIASYKALYHGGAKLIAWDDNEANRKSFIEKLSKEIPESQLKNSLIPISQIIWNKLSIIILSPGIPTNFPSPHEIVKKANLFNIKIISDIEVLYLSNLTKNFIAITGTNGKSTTTSLIGHILKNANLSTAIGGNIGEAAMSLPELEDNGYYVIECSSFQLELMDKFKPQIAVLLNLTPDHLDRYQNMEDYANAKSHIFKNQDENDYAIISIDGSYTKQIYKDLCALKNNLKIIPISTESILSGGGYIHKDKIIFENHFEINYQPTSSLLGKHNQENIIASSIAAYLAGVKPEIIEQELISFKSLPHRMELLGYIDKIAYVNDSKATNIDSACKALSSYKNIIWIAGGYQKGEEDLNKISPYLNNIKCAFLIGQSAPKLEDYLKDKIEICNAKTLDVAVREARIIAQENDVILLSPAFASFDQFKDFNDRGEQFRSIFNSIKTQ